MARLQIGVRAALGSFLGVLDEPVIGLGETVAQAGAGTPAERRHTAHIHQLARGAVGPGRVEGERAAKPDHIADGLREFADRHVATDADVHRFRRRVALHQEHQRIGEIVDEQEFAPRRAAAPHVQRRLARVLGAVRLLHRQ